MAKMPALAVIAIDRYLQWTRLANPVRDAREIRDLIVERRYVDEGCGLGIWILANAGTDPYEQQNRLPHTQLGGLPANMQAMHLFVISDSCLAGDLLNAPRAMRLAADADYFRVAYGRTSRQVLTSGATEPVPEVSDFAARPKTVLAVHSERRGVVYVDGVRYGETGAGPVHRPPRTLPGGCGPATGYGST